MTIMKAILILFTNQDINDAEHARGVLEEELQSYKVQSYCVGKEVLQTDEHMFVFRNVDKPLRQNVIWSLKKVYVTKAVKEKEDLSIYKENTDVVVINRPTSGIIDYVMDVQEEIPTDKETIYIIENEKVKEKQVEVYKLDRMSFYQNREEAELILWNQQEKRQKEEEMKAEQAKRNRKKKVLV